MCQFKFIPNSGDALFDAEQLMEVQKTENFSILHSLCVVRN